MTRAFAGLLAALTACTLFSWCGSARALSAEQARAIVEGDNDSRSAAIVQAAASADPALPSLLQALLDDAVKITPDHVIVLRDGKAVDAISGQPVELPADAEDATNNNRMRREIEAALASTKLLSPDVDVRRRALDELGDAGGAGLMPLLDKADVAETDAGLKTRIALLRSRILVSADDPAQRLRAASALAESGESAVRNLLVQRLQDGVEPDALVRAELRRGLASVEQRLAWGERIGTLFAGVSLGSILLLVALGLAITYGLMGVINMAHGELMMIGAYATYVVQRAFQQWLPQGFDLYLVAAIPAAFVASAAVGAVLERSVIRWLYGRPLETLLATWGISLILIQAMRSLFGAQNVPVENPSWLSGGVSVMSNLTLPYNRLAIIGFAVAVLVAVTLLIARTRLGLFVRGVTQNRRMAACLGVNTARVDTSAFALGAGIAGLAGCALSQVGNVGPDLGQSYIVDSFMVVVLGGVGQLAGTVVAALGLGVVNKLLEGWAGAVLAKIMVLAFIVVFIQKRPQGLFAMRGRSAEA
jgi:urea transport system permease protein